VYFHFLCWTAFTEILEEEKKKKNEEEEEERKDEKGKKV
jgi:hypothetical protein